MVKKITLALMALGAALLLPIAAMAASAKTDVTGKVTLNGSPVKGAKVVVTCNGHSKNATTNSNGDYLVSFSAKKCPAGSPISVGASKKHKGSGSSSGVASPVTTKLNVALVNVAIPELGFVTGALALVAAAGLFLVMRRQRLAQL